MLSSVLAPEGQVVVIPQPSGSIQHPQPSTSSGGSHGEFRGAVPPFSSNLTHIIPRTTPPIRYPSGPSSRVWKRVRMGSATRKITHAYDGKVLDELPIFRLRDLTRQRRIIAGVPWKMRNELCNAVLEVSPISERFTARERTGKKRKSKERNARWKTRIEASHQVTRIITYKLRFESARRRSVII
jgi:hypothetical protein